MAGAAAVARFQAWQAARVQAQAVMTRALCHDLRGMLAPGLLVAERLQGSGDASLRVAGDRVAAMVARATARLRPDHEYAGEVSVPALESVSVGRLPMPVPVALELVRDLPAEAMVRVNLAGFAAAFRELATNSAAAGARAMRVSAQVSEGYLAILARDDGPGLAVPLLGTLFAPPSGPDDAIGLSLARDLLRGMGGDLSLIGAGAGSGLEIRLQHG